MERLPVSLSAFQSSEKEHLLETFPDEIEGKPVTVIDWYAFERCEKLESVVIPETDTYQQICICTLHFIGIGQSAKITLLH